jgi:RimJ/RimL family protein N-acetyltransferase
MAVARRAGAVHEGLARNRLQLRGRAVDAHMFSLIPV